MNKPEEYRIFPHFLFLESINKMRERAIQAKNLFLAIEKYKPDLNNLKMEELDDATYLNTICIIQCYKDFIFFPDEQILDKFKALGYKKHISSWLISIDVLNDHFDKICLKKIKVDRYLAIHFIKAHLCIKFINDIGLAVTPTTRDEVNMTASSEEFIKLVNRRKYSNSDPKRFKNPLEVSLNQLLRNVLEFTSGEVNEKSLVAITRGKTDVCIQKLVAECFEYDKKHMSSAKFFSIIYDLIAVIMPDKNFITSENFFTSKKRTYQSYDNFDAYKAKKIRSIVNPKRKKS